MTRLIGAEKLKKHYAWWDDDEKRTLFDQIVDAQPTIDAEPVRHGKWVNANEGRWNTCEVLKCSACGELDNRMYKTDKYCPNCGARMDEK